MPGSFITSDIAATLASSDFGEVSGAITWRGTAIPYGIFDDEDVEIQMGEGVSEIAHQAVLTARSADFPGIADNDPVTIDGTNYKVKYWMDDGTGQIDIYLEKQP